MEEIEIAAEQVHEHALAALVAVVVALASSGARAAGGGVHERLPTQLLYSGRSVEFPVAREQVYRLAERELLPRLKSLEKDWAVVMDVDETVLDNYEYERRENARGTGFDEKLWDDWVAEKAAPAVPGAKAFVDKVHAAGARGRIVYITDRDEDEQRDTASNLAAAGLFIPGRDVLLTKRDKNDSKEARRRCVEKGRTGTDPRCAALPATEIMATFGDAFSDHIELHGPEVFVEGLRRLRACAAAGRCYVVPNPMYGPWEPDGSNGPYQ